MRNATWRIYCAHVVALNISKPTRSNVAPLPQVCLHIQSGLRMGPPESNSAHLDFHAVLYLENEFYSSHRFGVPAAQMDDFVHVVHERNLVATPPQAPESISIGKFCCWTKLHPYRQKRVSKNASSENETHQVLAIP